MNPPHRIVKYCDITLVDVLEYSLKVYDAQRILHVSLLMFFRYDSTSCCSSTAWQSGCLLWQNRSVDRRCVALDKVVKLCVLP